MNIVVLIGNLTKDITLKTTQGGNHYCNFTIAINNGKDKDGNDIPADFPQISVFGKQAENCAKYLAKGMKVAVHGKIKTSSKQNQDGSSSFYTNVVAEKVEFIEWADNKQGQAAPGAAPQGYAQPAPAGIPPQGYVQPAPAGMPPQGYAQPAPNGMPPQGYAQPAPQMQNNGVPEGFTPAPEDQIDYGFDPNQL